MKRLDKLLIEQQAVQFRNMNGYSADAPIHLTSLLLKNNVITIFKPLSDTFSGMAIKAPNNIRFILINSNHVIAKQHFTIGHELYHLFIQENFNSQKCQTGLFEKQSEAEERNADYFSANLLMPDNGIIQLIPTIERRKNKISDSTLFKIQQYYSLSVNATIFRLIELDFVDKSYYEKYDGVKKSIARKLGYDMHLFETRQKDVHSGAYGSLADKLLKNQKISESYYLELMNAINVDPFANND